MAIPVSVASYLFDVYGGTKYSRMNSRKNHHLRVTTPVLSEILTSLHMFVETATIDRYSLSNYLRFPRNKILKLRVKKILLEILTLALTSLDFVYRRLIGR